MKKKSEREISCIDCEMFGSCEVKDQNGPIDENRCTYSKVKVINKIKP